MLRHLLLALAALPLAAGNALAADASPLAVATDIYALVAETTMVSVEVDPDKHAAMAVKILQRLDTTVPVAITAIADNDAARAADLTMNWEDMKSAYQGESFAIAFRENSYDTNLTARYMSGSDALLMAFDPAATKAAANSPEQQVRLRVLKTITSYLKTSTGIVGGTSQSANDLDNDVPAGVAAVDKGLAELKQKYAGKPQAAALKATTARWSFLRPALLKSSNQSTPFIVYTHGVGVARSLDELAGAAATAN